jgi:adenylate cyclase
VAAPPNAPGRARRWLVALVVVVLAASFDFTALRSGLDRAFFDATARNPPPFHREPLPTNSALVLIDDHTMDLLGRDPLAMRWPFPRSAFAGLIAALDRSGARKIVMDLTFLDKGDRAEFDLILAGTAAAVPSVVLARTDREPPAFWERDYQEANPSFFKVPRMGKVDLLPDSDGICRSYSVPGSLASLAMENPVATPGGRIRWHGGIEDLRREGVPVLSAGPLIEQGLGIIYRIVDQAPGMSPEEIGAALAKEPMLSNPTADLLRGRTVFVGASASGTFDLGALPVGRLEPRVLLHWTAWANLVGHGFIGTVGWGAPVLGALAVLSVFWAGMSRSSLTGPGIACGAWVLGAYFGSYGATAYGIWIPPATPAIAALMALLGVAAESFWEEQRRKREVAALFGSYVDPAVLTELLRNPSAIRLGGERRVATVCFLDLAGFTDLSEKLSSEQLVSVVNRYLEEMSNCLFPFGAYIDKYIGDAVMAVFGVPLPVANDALAACRAALAAQAAMEGINQSIGIEGTSLSMRIGINTGEMIAGNVGSTRKTNYTVLGDAVNLASRLEGANKRFRTSILIGEATAARVASHMETRPLARLRVKGKTQAVEVHELVGAADSLPSRKIEFLSVYREGYALYRAGRFEQAAQVMERAGSLSPGDCMALEIMTKSLEYAQCPPPPDWTIVELDSK